MELLKYIQHTKLPDWNLEERTWGWYLISPDREISLIILENYEKAFIDDTSKETHYYNSTHLSQLLSLIEILELNKFEVIKTPLKPLSIKTDFFYICIAPFTIMTEEVLTT